MIKPWVNADYACHWNDQAAVGYEVPAAKQALANEPDRVVEAGHFQNQVDACDVGRLRVLEALHSLAPEKQA